MAWSKWPPRGSFQPGNFISVSLPENNSLLSIPGGQLLHLHVDGGRDVPPSHVVPCPAWGHFHVWQMAEMSGQQQRG